ncbi:hypothetical protein [Streptomyces sp. Ag109_O5-1]|nr:hypothetical protein [Streptomyces sp. Ag109_O5-1]
MVARPSARPDRRESLLAGIGEVVDAMGGGVTMRCTALVLTAVRTAGR